MKHVKIITSVLALLCFGTTAQAAINEYEENKAKVKKSAEVKVKKVPWRNSVISYENIFSAISLDKGAELQHNPYYAQSLSFRPRYYLRDDLSLRARLDLEIELTTADDTDRAREWILSDLFLDLFWAPSFLKIPVVDVMVIPSLRTFFPTSKQSRARSLMLGLAPGVALMKNFPLLKGRWLKSLTLMYGFRTYKYFNEYTTSQIDTNAVCAGNPENPGCLHTGKRNVNWRFLNSFEARLQITDKLVFTADLLLYNSLLYKLSAEEVALADKTSITLGDSTVNHSAAIWGILDVTYDVLDWLWLSVGVSTFHPQLTPDSDYRAPFFNRYTRLYFDITLPVDRFISQVQRWTGKGE